MDSAAGHLVTLKYAAQNTIMCTRLHGEKKKCVELYTKIGPNLYSEILARVSCKITCKTTASNAVSKLVVDISDNDSWENQLVRIRSEANRRQMSIIPYKYTSPEKHIETTIAGDERKNVAVGMGRNGNMVVVATNEFVNSATVMYSSTAGWKRS